MKRNSTKLMALLLIIVGGLFFYYAVEKVGGDIDKAEVNSEKYIHISVLTTEDAKKMAIDRFSDNKITNKEYYEIIKFDKKISSRDAKVLAKRSLGLVWNGRR